MTGSDGKGMTPQAFLDWHAGLDGLYELIDGLPVPHIKMRHGVSAEHDLTKVNLISSLGTQLRRTDFRVTTGRLPISTRPGTLRRPDLAVVRDQGPDAGDVSRDPRLVVEILSPATCDISRFAKLDEYRRHPTLAYILLVETRFPSALLYRRASAAWLEESFGALTEFIQLPTIGARLALADIYEDVVFEPDRPSCSA